STIRFVDEQSEAYGSVFDTGREEISARKIFARHYISTLLYQQFILIVLLIPALAAGALGREKECGTLLPLLTTDLTPLEIVSGKLWSRLALLFHSTLGAIPLLVLMISIAEVPVVPILLALIQAAVISFAL